MIERQLQQQLERISRRIGWQRLLWRCAACWLAGATALAVAWVVSPFAWSRAPALATSVIAAGTLLLAGTFVFRARRQSLDARGAARAIERKYPELNDRLLAAAEQQPSRSSGRLSYLQRQVVENVLAHRRRNDWRSVVPTRRMALALAVQCFTLAAFISASVVLLRRDAAAKVVSPTPHSTEAASSSPLDDDVLTVEPGDVEIERGTSLLVLARFDGRLPSHVGAVVTRLDSPPGTFELTRSLDDPLFGGHVPDVQTDLVYRIEYDGRRSRDFRVTVFDYPCLETADITVIAPPYAAREPVTIPDARRVSVLEGSQVTLVCRVNKRLAAAELQTVSGESPESILLQTADGDELAWTATVQPTASTRYRLLLTDAAGRANKLPSEFAVEVVPNRPPELKLTFPGKDVRISPLEELSLEATAWDDIGLVRYGVAYSHDGREETLVLGEGAAKQQEAALAYQLLLEELDAEPDELVSYYFFADDHGPDGTIRRTASDMFFAEVRPFEEIYREGQQPPGGGGAAGGGGPQGQKIEQLGELQKQIVNATWSLIRQTRTGTRSASLSGDIQAVAESQEAAITQLGELREKLEDAKSQRFADEAGNHMQQAIEYLRSPAGLSQGEEGEKHRRTDFQSVRAPRPDGRDADSTLGGRSGTPAYGEQQLDAALLAERAAYQALLRLRAREHDVVRGQGGGGGGGGGGGASQQQLDQLELTSKENRYQTEQRAQSTPPSVERESLQVLNRLRELARRQSGVNQQLKELELALQNAQTPAEREELERRLKRLRDEQQQMLRDLDELRDRMDQPQNQQQMSDARQQVDQTRQQVREASEALREGQVSQAISSGTRAERALDELREDFRRRTAHQFADAMNDLREQAEELSERQKQLGESLAELDTGRRSLRGAEERRNVSRELSGQQDRLHDVLDHMRQVIEAAEHSEPLLSKQLYDAARQARADAPEKSLESASQLADRGLLPDARAAADQAQRGIDSLRDGVRTAADAILGNELDALKRARNDVRDLARDLDRELAQAGDAKPGNGESNPSQTADASNGGPSADRPERQSPSSDAPRSESSAPGTSQSPESQNAANEANRPAETAPQEQPATDGQQPGDSAAPMGGEAGGMGSSSAATPAQDNASGSTPGQGSSGEGGGQGRGSSSRGEGRQQRPSLLSNGGQSGGPGDGPGGRAGPLTGDEFQQWSDRMRDVEETVGEPELRDEVSRIRERARSVRAEFKRHAEEPNWDLVRGEILEPLLELENRLAEEVARRESPDTLVPIDRDPVPTRFAEAVRDYYERLGGGAR